MANLPVLAFEAERANEFVRNMITQRVPHAQSTLLKAFSRPEHSNATDVLERLGWRVWEDLVNWDQDIFDQAMSDSGQGPEETVVFLITADADFTDLVEDLKQSGVRVYVVAPSTVTPALVGVVGSRRHIAWPSKQERQ